MKNLKVWRAEDAGDGGGFVTSWVQKNQDGWQAIQNAFPNGDGWNLKSKANAMPPKLPIAPTMPVIKPFDPGLQCGTKEKLAPFAISSTDATMIMNTIITATAYDQHE